VKDQSNLNFAETACGEGSLWGHREAINAGDRIDSSLKDMAVVMNQQNRPMEAIEAIKSFRHLCSKQAQEPLDNVLIDLFKVLNSNKSNKSWIDKDNMVYNCSLTFYFVRLNCRNVEDLMSRLVC
jgi:hypothetical protein